jgi:hypothetical protein
MQFHVAALAARIVLHTAGSSLEGVVNGQAKILVRRLYFEPLAWPFFSAPANAGTQVGLALYDEFAAG